MRASVSRHFEGRDADDYERFVVEARGGHYGQTRRWAGVATAGRSERALEVLVRDGGRVVGCALVRRWSAGGLGGPVARIERGPVCDDPELVAPVARVIARALRLRGIVRLSVMPYWSGSDAGDVERALAKARFRSVQAHDGAHACTVRLSLGGRDDDEILAGPERRALRSELKQARRHGLVARRVGPEGVGTLARLHADLMRRQGRSGDVRPPPFFDRLAMVVAHANVALFLGEHEGEALAAVLAVRHGRLATFVMGATDASRRPFTKMAPTLMAAVRWARDAGAEAFDLGGVPMPGDADPKRVAIARFKLDFASALVRLVGEHVRWL
jgi:lipid II:glycine glycyltransferase (peptidoglycan interpeptide bridge formation enzyme)